MLQLPEFLYAVDLPTQCITTVLQNTRLIVIVYVMS